MDAHEIRNHNYELAKKLATKGFYVFPVYGEGDRRKTPFLRWKEESTQCLAKIEQWWKSPTCTHVPAIDCGKSSLFILDADRNKGDSQEDGVYNILKLFDALGIQESDLFTVSTPSGGRHYYFKNNYELGNSTGDLPKLIDARGVGGYIVAVGSIFADGTSYTRQNGRNLIETPKELYDILTSRKGSSPGVIIELSDFKNDNLLGGRIKAYFSAANKLAIDKMASAGEGKRNETLFIEACRLFERINSGYASYDDIEALKRCAESKGLDPLKEIEPTIKSSYTSVGSAKAVIPKSFFDMPETIKPAAPPSDEEYFYQENYIPSRGFKKILKNWLKKEIYECYPDGLLGDICRYMENTAYIKQPQLFIGASLALGSFMAGRGVENFNDSSNNLFICNISDTGTGKGHPQGVVKKLIAQTRLSNLATKNLDGSYEILTQTLQLNPVQLVIADEFGRQYAQQKTSGTSAQKVFSTYTELWNSPYKFDVIGTLRNNGGFTVYHPYVCILGSGTIEQIFENMSDQEVADGTLNRYIIFKGDDEARSSRVKAKPFSELLLRGDFDVNQTIAQKPHQEKHFEDFEEIKRKINVFCELTNIEQRKQADYSLFLEVGLFDEAKYLFDRLKDDLDEIRINKEKEKNVVPRVLENSLRVATVMAIINATSENIRKKQVYVTHSDAWLAINYCLNSALIVLQQLHKFSSGSQFEKDAKYLLTKIKETLAKSGKDFVTKAELSKAIKSRFGQRYKDEILLSLQEETAIDILPAEINEKAVTIIKLVAHDE